MDSVQWVGAIVAGLGAVGLLAAIFGAYQLGRNR